MVWTIEGEEVIRFGDSTTHGGKVLSASPNSSTLNYILTAPLGGDFAPTFAPQTAIKGKYGVKNTIGHFAQPLVKVEGCDCHKEVDGITKCPIQVTSGHAKIVFYMAYDGFNSTALTKIFPRL